MWGDSEGGVAKVALRVGVDGPGRDQKRRQFRRIPGRLDWPHPTHMDFIFGSGDPKLAVAVCQGDQQKEGPEQVGNLTHGVPILLRPSVSSAWASKPPSIASPRPHSISHRGPIESLVE
eukprot:m.198842 g.198842  ORF g.198842 m.198842 type:complete len:119 (+) comp15303_c0_seq3:1831-2187(+)